MSDVPWHFLPPNEGLRYPRRVVVLDVEAWQHETKRGERHSFRCAAASFDEIDRATLEPSRSERAYFESAAELWGWVDRWTRPKGRLVVFAHNLAYDLRVGGGLTELQRLGYRQEFLTFDSSRCVARYKRGNRTLILTDLHSFLPTSLERIGDRLGLRKPPLPKRDAPAAKWRARCEMDVEITRAAVLRLLRYLESNELGSFKLTGPAQAGAAFRHLFMERYSLLVHRDEDALAAERRAAWAGRCEVWRHGEVAGPLYEWDFELAYCRIARSTYLPAKLRGQTGKLSTAELHRLARTRCVLADVVCETEHPLVPTRGAEGILWPVGRFRTTLWDNELIHAATRGARFTIERAWLYHRRPALARWAEWLLAQLGPDGLPERAIERVMLKHWSRALIGRFGLRYLDWQRVAELDEPTLELEPYEDVDTGESGWHLRSGRDWFESQGMIEAPDSMPAIMGYIIAACRVRLLDAIEAAGAEHVAYLDTDSLIVDREGHTLLETWSQSSEGAGLRLKGEYRRALLLAPRQIVVDHEPRASGLPRGAIRRGPRSFEAVFWQGMAESIRTGQPDQVRLTRRRLTLRARDKRRRHLAGDGTAPIRVELTASAAAA